MSNILDASKNNLGKLLASENIRIEHQKVTGPYFDVKERVLVLPIWKDMDADLYDLMIGHEVGHALYTPTDGWLDEVKKVGPEFKSFLNIVEDARIEKKMKRKYPGLRKPMYNGYTQLVERNFFGMPLEDMKYMPFVDRLNVYFKLGARTGVSFNDAEQSLVDRIEACEDWDEVMVLARELHNMSKEEKSQLDDIFDDLMELLDSDDMGLNSDSFGEFNPNASTQDLDSKVKEVADKLRASGKNTMADALENASDQAKKRISEWMENGGESSITDEALKENEEKLLDEKALPISYVNWPKIDTSKWVIPHAVTHKLLTFSDHQESKRNSIYQDFMSVNKRYVNYLVKEFELRRNAKQFAKAKVSKTGKLDVDKVWKHKLSEDLFLQSTVVPNGKNHGMLMIVDMSSSMAPNISGTLHQVISLAMFCRKVNIPFEVYGFIDNAHYDEEFRNANIPVAYDARNIPQNKSLYITNTNFRLKQLLTNTMKLNQFNNAIQNLLLLADCYSSGRAYYYYGGQAVLPPSMQLSSTPLNESILVLSAVAEEFKKATKVEVLNTIILTDGDASFQIGYYEDGKVQSLDMYNRRVILEHGQHQVRYNRSYNRATNDLLTMYKMITGSRVIGIYLMDGHNYKGQIYRKAFGFYEMQYDFDKQYQEEFLKNRFFGLKVPGYDVYYMVPGNDLEIKDVNLDTLVNKNDASKNHLLRAFKKMQNNKMISRVFLNQFIQHIS